MKRLVIMPMLLLFIVTLSSCEGLNDEPNAVYMLYSKSYENTNDFEEVIPVIDNYETYLLSGYPLDLNETFFEDNVLYTHAFEHHSMGTELFLFDHHEVINSDQLVIYYEENKEIEVLDAFGMYAMIFSIDKTLYLSVDTIEVKEADADSSTIELIYSGSYENFHVFDEAIPWIRSYNDYLDSGYPFELDAVYFDDYSLYTFSFVHSNLGRNIFLYDNHLIVDNNLLIKCITNPGVIVSPAFGKYALVFAIPKALESESLEVMVTLDSVNDMVFNEAKEVRMQEGRNPLYFTVTEEAIFGINFSHEDAWSITAVTGRLFNLNNNQEITMTMFSGLYGYQATVPPGEYVFILEVRSNDFANELVYEFDYNAGLANEE